MFQAKQRQTKNECSLSGFIPYASLVEDDTVMLRDRTLLACFYIEGIPFETKSSEEVQEASSVFNRILTGLEDDRLSTGRTHQKLSKRPRYRSPFIGELTRGTF